ncbi:MULTISPECIES: transketolase C-terminal domain-containing protein [unclassified Enterococcus]|uniref:transketolase family protein n=1 Tax=unclassified Enterococcus TaxID=2608891 RepID=UPI001556A4CE|nr:MULTISPECIES: transketolase C-terminal domain-containing protein [unclassified Enterococcus]MBS7577903.1 transketolase family protein [Enterococcus sp. MMGLQ5-2]MBS7585236.1 transketolase family protein [Enterococcus sp. MMGLQ5-1]NPD13093.1 transketolase family protein [Enterococcus sp. MMGLQ5-1]NPD37733.1 transketolase family protein [Enterococcus sp. MMGLQ5-2]
MTYKIIEELKTEEKAMRDVYASTLAELAREDQKVVSLDADLMNSVGLVPLAKEFPNRVIDCGIQEANMFGTAAGMSAVGMVPFVHTFACFASRRIADQIFVSGAFAKANVRIIGSDPGVTAAFNGATHMPFEDIGILRGIPEVTVIEPTDAVMLEDMVRQTKALKGIFYIRMSRKNAVQVYQQGSSFEIGKVAKVQAGNDVTLFASGICVSESILAAKKLAEEGISAEVINVFTIKPIDIAGIVESVSKTGAAVTAENHNIINGLGSAVSEVLAENKPVPLERVGVKDRFGEVGSVDYLKETMGLTAADIVAAAKRAIARK